MTSEDTAPPDEVVPVVSAKRTRWVPTILDIGALEELAECLSKAVPEERLAISVDLDDEMTREFVSVAELEERPSPGRITRLEMRVGPRLNGPSVAVRLSNHFFSDVRMEANGLPEALVEELFTNGFGVVGRHRAWHGRVGNHPFVALLLVAAVVGVASIAILLAAGVGPGSAAPLGLIVGLVSSNPIMLSRKLAPRQLRVLVGPEIELWETKLVRRRWFMATIFWPLMVGSLLLAVGALVCQAEST